MLIREWMTEDVVTVSPTCSMLKASKLMKDNKIRRLPVINEKKEVVGIVSDRDIKDASPSKATTLAIHELHYLLSEIQIKDIMTADPITVLNTDTVESATYILEKNGFGSLPVVNEDDELVGIITDADIFKIYVAVTGSHYGGIQIALSFTEGVGILRPFLDLLHEHNASLVTLLSTECPEDRKARRVYVHLQPMDRSAENKLIEEIKEKFKLLYWVREKLFEK